MNQLSPTSPQGCNSNRFSLQTNFSLHIRAADFITSAVFPPILLDGTMPHQQDTNRTMMSLPPILHVRFYIIISFGTTKKRSNLYPIPVGLVLEQPSSIFMRKIIFSIRMCCPISRPLPREYQLMAELPPSC